MIITIAMFVLTCGLRCRQDSSLFTSAIVNLWLCFLLWSSLYLDQNECNTLYFNEGASWFNFVSHFIWTFITLFSLGTATQNEQSANPVKSGVAEDENEKQLDLVDIEGGVKQ